jgi:5-oxoprolinase (ATP-hydrolysing)
MTAGILSERRSVAPFGLFGGGPGQKGVNLLLRHDGRVVNLGGKATVALGAGDVMRICTPGAGGYGSPGSAGDTDSAAAGAASTAAAPQLLDGGSVQQYRRLQESA